MGFDPTEIFLQDGDFPPLCVALQDRDFEAATKLISEGARLDDLIEDDGNTFLHDAAQSGDLQMVDFFLDHECPATLEQFDCISNTPLSSRNTETMREIRSMLVNFPSSLPGVVFRHGDGLANATLWEGPGNESEVEELR